MINKQYTREPITSSQLLVRTIDNLYYIHKKAFSYGLAFLHGCTHIRMNKERINYLWFGSGIQFTAPLLVMYTRSPVMQELEQILYCEKAVMTETPAFVPTDYGLLHKRKHCLCKVLYQKERIFVCHKRVHKYVLVATQC